MSRGYVLTPLAETDPDDIWDYAAQRFGFDVADEVLESLHRAFRFLAEHPDAGHAPEDIAPSPYSFWPVGPSLIAFRPDVRPVQVIRVARGERDWSGRLLDVGGTDGGAGSTPGTGRVPQGKPPLEPQSAGVARNAIEAVEHLDQPAPQVVPDQELDGHLALAALGPGDDAAHPQQPAQHLLLRPGRHELSRFEGERYRLWMPCSVFAGPTGVSR